MKKTNLILSFYILIILSIFSQNLHAKVCVLSLFKNDSKEENKIAKIFKFYPEASLFKMAQIEDIKHCFNSQEFDEIVWISHGASVKTSISNYSSPILVKGDGNKVALPVRFFEKLLETMSPSIKKLRVSLCGVDFSLMDTKIHSSIDVLLKGSIEKGIEVDVKEKSKIATFLTGEDVTTLDSDWIAKSISKEDAKRFRYWKTFNNPRCKEDFWNGCDRESAIYVIPLSNERI